MSQELGLMTGENIFSGIYQPEGALAEVNLALYLIMKSSQGVFCVNPVPPTDDPLSPPAE